VKPATFPRLCPSASLAQFFAIQADVTKEDSISAAVDKVIEKAGALHGMVANAGTKETQGRTKQEEESEHKKKKLQKHTTAILT
jgi:NAD(P)-dependent dehydrogenase (short-subunit alcohol dehydrogenase family)